jgi:hypothetical protein
MDEPGYIVRVQRLDPILADLSIEFTALPAEVQVRGRLMGPRCPGVTTIEIAYPLQVVAHPIYRVLIPEPTYWSDKRPFVYEGPVELLRDGQVVGRLTVSIGVGAGASVKA